MTDIKATKRRRISRRSVIAGVAGLPLFSGCIEEEEEEYPHRGELLSITQTGRQNTFGPRSRRYWMAVPYYSEILHMFELLSEIEGHAELGTMNLEISDVDESGERLDPVIRFENINIEAEPEITHELHPGYYSVELDGSDLGREIELDWTARTYEYLGDGSNIECPEKTENIEINYLSLDIGRRRTDPYVTLEHDIRYNETTSDTYELDMLLQTPTEEDDTQIYNNPDYCCTPFISESDFSVSPESPYKLHIEMKDDGEVEATKTVTI